MAASAGFGFFEPFSQRRSCSAKKDAVEAELDDGYLV